MTLDQSFPVFMLVVLVGFLGFAMGSRQRHGDAEDHGIRIVRFRCSSCDCLWRSPPTPFNRGRWPLCMSCAERNFPNEFRAALERKP